MSIFLSIFWRLFKLTDLSIDFIYPVRKHLALLLPQIVGVIARHIVFELIDLSIDFIDSVGKHLALLLPLD